MLLSVNPTRMEMLGLRKRLAVAMRGHHMLKDKLDELVRRFLELVQQYQGLREDVEKRLVDAIGNFTVARGAVRGTVMDQVLRYNDARVTVTRRPKRILNLIVPEFKVSDAGTVYSYGFADTTATLDAALGTLGDLLPAMVRLAQLEKSIQLLAVEIETTRRRVNALEYILIPAIEETIHSIRMKIEERDRSALTRLMKVKEIIQAKG
ncbi:MAG: V-type ATP synthase subunit D [Planctomycetota bacterium]